MNKLFLILILINLNACALMTTDLDPKTGLFPVSTKAKVLISKPLNIDEKKPLLLVRESVEGYDPEHSGDTAFNIEQIDKIGYFDKIITFQELEELIIVNNLTDKVPSLDNKISLSNAAKHYKPFLLLEMFIFNNASHIQQLTLTDPLTLEVYFMAQSQPPTLDLSMSGSSMRPDKYSLYNVLIHYIKNNSNTF